MSLTHGWFGEGICWGAAFLFVLVALPIAAVATVLLRAVFLVVAVVGGAGAAVAYCANPRFRSWVDGRPATPQATGQR